MPKWLKILLTILAVIAGVVIILFVLAWVFQYKSVIDMLQHVFWYIGFIWEDRIVGALLGPMIL